MFDREFFDMTRTAPEAKSLPSYVERIRTRRRLEDLFLEVTDAGWLVNNCFQLKDRSWRVNLRRIVEAPNGTVTHYYEYAEGYTAVEAAAAAIMNMRQPRNLIDPVFNYTETIVRKMVEAEITYRDLIAAVKRYPR